MTSYNKTLPTFVIIIVIIIANTIFIHRGIYYTGHNIHFHASTNTCIAHCFVSLFFVDIIESLFMWGGSRPHEMATDKQNIIIWTFAHNTSKESIMGHININIVLCVQQRLVGVYMACGIPIYCRRCFILLFICLMPIRLFLQNKLDI